VGVEVGVKLEMAEMGWGAAGACDGAAACACAAIGGAAAAGSIGLVPSFSGAISGNGGYIAGIESIIVSTYFDKVCSRVRLKDMMEVR